MKKRLAKATKVLAAALAVMTLLTGCGTSAKDAPMNTYTVENGMFSVSLPGEWTAGDNMGVDSMLDLTSEGGMEVVMLGMVKNQVSEQSGVTDLQSFFNYVDTMFLNGDAATTELKDAEKIELAGTTSAIAKEGTMTQNTGGKGKVFVECSESENAYYLTMITGTLGYSKKLSIIKERMVFEELDVPVPEALSDTLKWFNASYAIITKVNGGDLNLAAGFEPSDVIASSMQQMLSRDWEVTDKASLDESVEWLLTEGHNADALAYLAESKTDDMSRDELVAAMQENAFTAEQKTIMLAAFDAKAAYGDKALLGWDLSRAMSMLGWGYLSGFYTYEEAMDKSLEVAQTIQQSFSSWDDFVNSYFYGYCYWSGNDQEDTSSSAYERRQIYEEIKADENSPYSVDFASALQKEW